MTDFDMDTNLVLANTVHDVKNSLGLINNEIEEIVQAIEESAPEQAKQLQRIRLEAARINNDLMHMLGMYRVHKGTLSVSLAESMVADLLEEVSSRYQSTLKSLGVEIVIDADDPDMMWFFDPFLIEGILHNVITNAIRYTRSKLTLRAAIEDNWLVIEVRDDGDGYPDAMLHCLDDPIETDMDFNQGSSGLGIYFSSEIAKKHVNGDRQGLVQLSNAPEGGAVFTLRLP